MTKVAIVGFGNIGKAAYEAVITSPDLTLAGVVECDLTLLKNLHGVQTAAKIDELKEVDVAILATPSRTIPPLAESILRRGIHTVDPYDMHTNIVELRRKLQEVALEKGVAAITAAGWDPGSDSMIRALFEAMAPKGITYTDFGPGMSMGHSVAARSIAGVENALSITIPLGTGIHRRMVYVELSPGADEAKVVQAIKSDSYFAHDETHVMIVPSVAQLLDKGHGVVISRKGVSADSYNQNLQFSMKVNNPALTGQLLVACARAVVKQQPGCYTMIEIAPIDLLPGKREELIKRLV